MSDRQRRYYRGISMKPDDLLKELVWALVIVLGLGLILAAVFSSPDEPALTAQRVAKAEPSVLAGTALRALAGQSAIAEYGPPYNNQPGAAQSIGGFSPQTWAGVQIPINAPKAFVLRPLASAAALSPNLKTALLTYEAAPRSEQQVWVGAALKVLPKARYDAAGVVLPKGDYGPLPTMLDGYFQLAKSGLLEAAINQSGSVYQTDFTQALLLLQGQAMADAATPLHMLGAQWGMMREPDNYPGAVWLWLYTALYQVPPYSTSSSADLLVGLTISALSLILLLVPFIPGLRDIPRVSGIHRLIWRRPKER
ncbi:MAG: hypothetical protein M0Z66_02375 [Thermaerobacter sp.]|nr:hypothetical protein [Thermaerobacter sp.]